MEWPQNLAADASLDIAALLTDVVMPQMSGPGLGGDWKNFVGVCKHYSSLGIPSTRNLDLRRCICKNHILRSNSATGCIAGRNLQLTSGLQGCRQSQTGFGQRALHQSDCMNLGNAACDRDFRDQHVARPVEHFLFAE